MKQINREQALPVRVNLTNGCLEKKVAASLKRGKI
jgi:hypothetical protein